MKVLILLLLCSACAIKQTDYHVAKKPKTPILVKEVRLDHLTNKDREQLSKFIDNIK